ncbi:MAG TPA: hemerythrin domain-containing protein [Streptosporangiaceae bacterium]
MADIIELILADHRRLRRLVTALGDATRHGEDPGATCMSAAVWDRLAGLLELHAEAEEEICYLAMFGPGQDAAARMQDAIADHDDIREAVAEARLHPPGSAAWWRAVTAARRASSDHIAREERGALATFGRSPARRPDPRTSSTPIPSTQAACPASCQCEVNESRRLSTAGTSRSPATAWRAPSTARAADTASGERSSALLGMQAQ